MLIASRFHNTKFELFCCIRLLFYRKGSPPTETYFINAKLKSILLSYCCVHKTVCLISLCTKRPDVFKMTTLILYFIFLLN